MAAEIKKCSCCLTSKRRLADSAVDKRTGAYVSNVLKLKDVYEDIKYLFNQEPILLCDLCQQQLATAQKMKKSLFKSRITKNKKSFNPSGELESTSICRCCLASVTFLLKEKDEVNCVTQIRNCFPAFSEKEFLTDPDGMVVLCSTCRINLDLICGLKERIVRNRTGVLANNIKVENPPPPVDSVTTRVKIEQISNDEINCDCTIKVEPTDEVFEKVDVKTEPIEEGEEEYILVETMDETVEEEEENLNFEIMDELCEEEEDYDLRRRRIKFETVDDTFDENEYIKFEMMDETVEEEGGTFNGIDGCIMSVDPLDGSNDMDLVSYIKLVNQETLPFKCVFCDTEFEFNSDLQAHIQKNHAAQRPFICKYCDRTYPSRFQKIGCEKLHTSEQCTKPFKCQYCQITYATRSDLNDHITVHDSTKPRLTPIAPKEHHQCTICHKQFQTDAQLQQHTKRHQTFGEEADAGLGCRFCNRTFKYEYMLRAHENYHIHNKIFRCKLCPKLFLSPQALGLHEKIHIEEAQIARMRNDSESLQTSSAPPSPKHLKIVDSKYKCLNCNEEFATWEEFLGHDRRTTDSLFICKYCNETFGTNCAMQVHQRNHHTPLMHYECKCCKEAFPEKADLQTHERQNHKMRTII